MLQQQIPMVRFLARRFHRHLPPNVQMDDLFSAGLVGLMEAYAKFDPAKEIKFASYAYFRVRGAMLDSLRASDWAPRELRHKGRVVREAIKMLTDYLGRVPSDDEVAAHLNICLDTYRRLSRDLDRLAICPLKPLRDDDSDEERATYASNREEDDSLSYCIREETRTRLINAIEDLPQRERLVATLYYYAEMTMREIGGALGIGESRISQLHSKAVAHMRLALRDLFPHEGRSSAVIGRKCAKVFRRTLPSRPVA